MPHSFGEDKFFSSAEDIPDAEKVGDLIGDPLDGGREALEIVHRPALTERMLENVNLLPDPQLQASIREAIKNAEPDIRVIEDCFARLVENKPSQEQLALFLGSWKKTHLKMNGIYGITIRLLVMADEKDDETEAAAKNGLVKAAYRNALTSFEDLGIGYGAETHEELYEDAALALLGDDSWQERKYARKEATEFGKWIFKTMVDDKLDLTLALMANLFSEIYNDAEYRLALETFEKIADFRNLDPESRERAVKYAQVHVGSEGGAEVEVAHLLSMHNAIQAYTTASEGTLDYSKAQALFEEYLRRLASAFAKM